jgi:hypothetical protein
LSKFGENPSKNEVVRTHTSIGYITHKSAWPFTKWADMRTIVQRKVLIDIINNIKGGIIDFSIINNGNVKCT